MDKETLREVKKIFLERENNLSEFATKSEDAIRLYNENLDNDIRPNYYHDIDRIIHSLSYTRYVDKTQVFSFLDNDHITKRMIHVQLVSKIARTIGRALRLNEDLIEAISLGHDIGHTPIGHAGEAMLNKISKRELNSMFSHNIQGVRNYIYLEQENLAIQTLDGIMCHNGEMVSNVYAPKKKTKEEFLLEYNNSYIDKKTLRGLRPMTLEGCVVRISDIIGYLGRDIEDAIRVGVLDKDSLPNSVKKILGTSNKEIVNNIVLDIIANSINKPYIKLSDEVFKAILDLKEFNYKEIYSKANTKEELAYYEEGMNRLYEESVNDIINNTYDSDCDIYKTHITSIGLDYLKSNSPKRIAIDYIAGMTDDYFKEKIKIKNSVNSLY